MSKDFRKQKVYILVKYNKDNCTVVSVYAKRLAACVAASRKSALDTKNTYHVLRKSVQGTETPAGTTDSFIFISEED